MGQQAIQGARTVVPARAPSRQLPWRQMWGRPSAQLIGRMDENRYRVRAREITEEARRQAGSARRLLDWLEQAGLRSPRGERYALSAVGHWVGGQAIPPGDVMLALADMAGIDVDGSAGADMLLELNELRRSRERAEAEIWSRIEQLAALVQEQLLPEGR